MKTLLSFASFDAFMCHYIAIAKEQGFCILQDCTERRAGNLRKRLRCKSKGCPFRINAWLRADGSVDVTSASSEHSCCDQAKATQRNRISNEDAEAIRKLHLLGDMSATRIQKVYPVYSESQIRYLLTKTESPTSSTCVGLIEDLGKRRQANPALWYEVLTDTNNVFSAAIWGYDHQLSLAREYGDTLVFDTTYKTNEMKLKLGLGIIADNNRKNRLVFQTILVREDTETFGWVFRKWVQIVDCYPRIIMTDRDLAMAQAVADEFGNAVLHRVCAFHIQRNIEVQLGSSIRSDVLSWFRRASFELISVKELDASFEVLRSGIIGKATTRQLKYLDELFAQGQHWAIAYVPDGFVAGIHSTQRCETMNAAIKKAGAGLSKSVGDLVELLDSFIWKQATFRPATNLKSITHSPIEDFLRDLIAPGAFEIVHKQLQQIGTCFSQKQADGEYQVIDRAIKERFNVTVQQDNASTITQLCCSCLVPTKHGFPCRHSLSVLLALGDGVTYATSICHGRWHKVLPTHASLTIKRNAGISMLRPVNEAQRTNVAMSCLLKQMYELSGTLPMGRHELLKELEPIHKRLLSKVEELAGVVREPVSIPSKGRPKNSRELSFSDRIAKKNARHTQKPT
jgi:hypothetical protein